MAVNDANPKVKDVEGQFRKIKDNTKKHTISGDTDDLSIGINHIQGIARTADNVFLTHNTSGDKGKLLICSRGDKAKLLTKMDLPHKGYNHPGGVQLIGDVLLVPLEKNTASFVMLYDISPVAGGDKPVRLPVEIERPRIKAGAAGITRYFDAAGGKDVHLLAVYDNGATWVYESNGEPLDSPDLSFTRNKVPDLKKSDYSSINLLTDDLDQVWLIGFRTGTDGAVYVHDRMDLYQYDFAKKKFQMKIDDHKVVTKHGGVLGSYGVHFRWAGGLVIQSPEEIAVLASQRNFVAGTMTYNVIRES